MVKWPLRRDSSWGGEKGLEFVEKGAKVRGISGLGVFAWVGQWGVWWD